MGTNSTHTGIDTYADGSSSPGTNAHTGEATRDASPDFTGDANTFNPDFGDNTRARRAMLSGRGA